MKKNKKGRIDWLLLILVVVEVLIIIFNGFLCGLWGFIGLAFFYGIGSLAIWFIKKLVQAAESTPGEVS